MAELSTIDKETEAARVAFLNAIGALPPHEITWGFGMLKEIAEQRIKECEETSMRHAHFGRGDDAKKALRQVEFYRKLIDLQAKWKDFEMRHAAPAIVEAVLGHKAQPRRKRV